VDPSGESCVEVVRLGSASAQVRQSKVTPAGAQRFKSIVGVTRTPLIRGKNIGPVTAGEFERLGIHTLEHLRDVGWREACLLWVERFPSRINLNAFRSVIGAVYGLEYNHIPPDEDAAARRMVENLRRTARAAKATDV
jgi:hypothetical protein